MEIIFPDSNTFQYVILPLLIFISRVCDVTLGTIRIILISRGKKYLAPLFGFLEVLIWVIVISSIMQNLNNIACILAYALGFGMGNYVGMLIEERLAMGSQLIRIITSKDASELIERLKDLGYGITSLDAKGSQGHVHIIYVVVDRNKINSAINTINDYNPNAFYTIEDVRYVNKGIMPKIPHAESKNSLFSKGNRPWRKGK